MGIGHRFGWQHDNGFQNGTNDEIEPLREVMNPRVQFVTATDDDTLRRVFSNGEHGIYDCSHLLDVGVFKE